MLLCDDWQTPPGVLLHLTVTPPGQASCHGSTASDPPGQQQIHNKHLTGRDRQIFGKNLLWRISKSVKFKIENILQNVQALSEWCLCSERCQVSINFREPEINKQLSKQRSNQRVIKLTPSIRQLLCVYILCKISSVPTAQLLLLRTGK